MKNAPQPEPLEIELLLSDDERRPITVDQHAAFQESLAAPSPADPIDQLVEDIRRAEFEEKGARP